MGVLERLEPEEALVASFSLFAEHCLKIRPKEVGKGIVPFMLNPAQVELHRQLNDMRRSTGKVRALVLKGRQMGVSTYVGARFYHQTVTRPGVRTFILTQEQDATDALFEMTRRYHEYNPLQVQTGASSTKELTFPELESGYKVGTAGSKAVGRGQTIQFFHGCLAAGSLIMDADGNVRRIEEYAVGDEIRTHTGATAKISFISTQQKECLSVNLRGIGPGLIATPEHRFWTRDGWKELGDLNVGEEIGLPVHEIQNDLNSFALDGAPTRSQGGGRWFKPGRDSLPADRALGLLFGLFLAEGTIIRQSKAPRLPSAISFAVHEREVDRTLAWLQPFSDCFSSCAVRSNAGALTRHVTVYGRSFAAMFERVLGSTDQKTAPTQWWRYGEDFALGLLDGYLSGDGHLAANDRRVRATSVRSRLTTQMRDIAAATGHGVAGIDVKKAGVRHGRNEREAFILSITGNGAEKYADRNGLKIKRRVRNHTTSKRPNAASSNVVEGGYAWSRISSISAAGLRHVYDFEVDHEDHSYCALHGATHNSEVAFWPNAESHVGGILEAVPSTEGTEIIFESTANGPAGIFYQMCRKAMAGEGEFKLIFLPWWLFPGYAAMPPSNWEPNDDFAAYQRRHGLTREQIYWAYKKNEEKAIPLGLDPEAICWLFRQEYPQSAVEAFQTAGDASFIAPEWVFAAREAGRKDRPDRRFAGERALPMVLGVDPAQGGGDSTVIIDRVGREAGMNVLYSSKEPDVMQLALTLSRMINLHHPSRVFIDHGGGGKELGDILSARGYGDIIKVVNFGAKASEPTKYVNKRAEMWAEMRDWFRNEAGVAIANDDGLHAAIVAPIWGPGATKETLDGRLQLEPKEHIRARLGGSPDEGDALALTFAEPVEMSGAFDAGDWDDDTVFRLNGL